MSTSSTAVDNISSLASSLFKRVDTNSDGRLSATEFQGFLETLLSKVGTKQTSGLGTEASAALSAATTQATGPRIYQGMFGFDYAKLNTSSHNTPKYVFARATQDVPLPVDRASRSAGLQKLVDYMKENGYPNAVVDGDDTINAGDGKGRIDVLTGDGQWWWGPKG